MNNSMTERDKILGRIREALTVPAPRPGHHTSGSHAPADVSPSSQAAKWLPPVGESADAQLAAFAVNATDLRAEFHVLKDAEELTTQLQKLRDVEGWKKIATHAGVLTDPASNALALPVCRTDHEGYSVQELESCDIGITECEALVAQTGSVLVTNRSSGGRAVSVLPPHHIVLARRDQMLRDLPEAFQLLKRKYSDNYPSMISFITGPSRTGDIERILVLGAHGPKRLTIFLF